MGAKGRGEVSSGRVGKAADRRGRGARRGDEVGRGQCGWHGRRKIGAVRNKPCFSVVDSRIGSEYWAAGGRMNSEGRMASLV